MRISNIRMALKNDDDTTAVFEIYDDIGEQTDWWTGQTTGISAEKVSEFLRDNESVKSIDLHINSNGGFVFEGIAIRNLLAGSGKEINVYIDGLAASIASVIATCGKVHMYKTSMQMVHNCWSWACGNAKELRQIADQMDKIMQSSKIAYLDKAGQKLTLEKLDELLDGESYLTAQECYELGLCDAIIDGQPSDPDPVATNNLDPKNMNKGMPVLNKEKPWFF